ncbi:hypothetical protein O3Q51_05345 [Cryomorphaceae bacterium 1068]|nr:hypothetical protein [Cryomorphaceae bacterium 1068]
MTSELIVKIDSFYDQPVEKQDDTLREVLAFANANPQKFKEIIHNEEFNELNQLPIYYEALSHDLDNWSDFFLEELNRLLAAARKSARPRTVLNHIQEFSFIKADQFKYSNDFIEILKKELDNPHPTFRYCAISGIADFMERNDHDLIDHLKKHLHDPNWRVRYWTRLTVEDLTKGSKPPKLLIADRLRAVFMSPLDFE